MRSFAFGNIFFKIGITPTRGTDLTSGRPEPFGNPDPIPLDNAGRPIPPSIILPKIGNTELWW